MVDENTLKTDEYKKFLINKKKLNNNVKIFYISILFRKLNIIRLLVLVNLLNLFFCIKYVNVSERKNKHKKHLHEILTPEEKTERCIFVNRDKNACKQIYWKIFL